MIGLIMIIIDDLTVCVRVDHLVECGCVVISRSFLSRVYSLSYTWLLFDKFNYFLFLLFVYRNSID